MNDNGDFCVKYDKAECMIKEHLCKNAEDKNEILDRAVFLILGLFSQNSWAFNEVNDVLIKSIIKNLVKVI